MSDPRRVELDPGHSDGSAPAWRQPWLLAHRRSEDGRL